MRRVWDEWCKMRVSDGWCEMSGERWLGGDDWRDMSGVRWMTGERWVAWDVCCGMSVCDERCGMSDLRWVVVWWVLCDAWCEMNGMRWVLRDDWREMAGVRWVMWDRVVWDEWCEMSGVLWVVWDEWCEMSGVRWLVRDGRCEMNGMRWLVRDEWCESTPQPLPQQLLQEPLCTAPAARDELWERSCVRLMLWDEFVWGEWCEMGCVRWVVLLAVKREQGNNGYIVKITHRQTSASSWMWMQPCCSSKKMINNGT